MKQPENKRSSRGDETAAAEEHVRDKINEDRALALRSRDNIGNDDMILNTFIHVWVVFVVIMLLLSAPAADLESGRLGTLIASLANEAEIRLKSLPSR